MRDVGGIRCGEVLALLSDLVDNELAATDRVRIETHVAECTECRRFGARFEIMLRTLRQTDVSPEIAASLDARLRAERGR
jgi:anti-sigma factor RsiW